MLTLARPGPPSLDLDSITEPDDKPKPLEHVGLVKSIALAYRESGRRCGLDLDDLIQSGCVGLMIACKRFDRGRGCKFSTYAIHWIRQAIRRALQNAHRPLRVPISPANSWRSCPPASGR
jgi:RNA polymerase sigma factor (sigma-70 family)